MPNPNDTVIHPTRTTRYQLADIRECSVIPFDYFPGGVNGAETPRVEMITSIVFVTDEELSV